jgi:dTDP-4-dehydrorhamnose reductase/SAM-dependent methyltransferase
MHVSCDLADADAVRKLFADHPCDMVINLAGQSDTDAVERDPIKARAINVGAVRNVAATCKETSTTLVQVSTQGVFSGYSPPYGATSQPSPVNQYGAQKLEAERIALDAGGMIVRPTFIMGVRVMPHWCRANPVEQMYAGQPKQVNDRWFSPLYAGDAAKLLWSVAVYRYSPRSICHLGVPKKTSRYEIATNGLGLEAEPVSHSSFSGIAERPIDTTYSDEHTAYTVGYVDTLSNCARDYRSQQRMDGLDRAREIALFLGKREEDCVATLGRGFFPIHAEVTQDFVSANPRNDDDLLEWYRKTESYIWELSAYHADPKFNYAGMCEGISERLRGAEAKSVLCLGDGIGDLTLRLRRDGFETVIYNDLEGSRTAAFAQFRLRRQLGEVGPCQMTQGWSPDIQGKEAHDAVVAADFLEHVTNVEEWVKAIKDVLKPRGILMAQNAFGIGSGDHGGMPMHLERNDRYVNEWDPLLAGLGFKQLSSNYYEKT